MAVLDFCQKVSVGYSSLVYYKLLNLCPFVIRTVGDMSDVTYMKQAV